MKEVKKYAILLLAALLSLACKGQETEKRGGMEGGKEKVDSETPKGSWEVTKEFDDEGNLIRYDSIYTWSSGEDLDELATLNRDSTLKSMQSRFYRNFSQFDFDKEGFGDLFAEDSLFTKRFFNDDFFESDFGKDFMDINKMHERMEALQKKFLDRYQPLLVPEMDKDSLNQD